MDKKLAEADALRKAKEQHNAAGKNTGMSGRDLVCHFPDHRVAFTYEYANAVPIQPRMVRRRGRGRRLGYFTV